MQRWRTRMTYYEKYSTLPEEVDLKAAMKHDADIVMIFFGGNPDRIKAIEDAGNRVVKEKGWDDEQ